MRRTAQHSTNTPLAWDDERQWRHRSAILLTWSYAEDAYEAYCRRQTAKGHDQASWRHARCVPGSHTHKRDYINLLYSINTVSSIAAAYDVIKRSSCFLCSELRKWAISKITDTECNIPALIEQLACLSVGNRRLPADYPVFLSKQQLSQQNMMDSAIENRR